MTCIVPPSYFPVWFEADTEVSKLQPKNTMSDPLALVLLGGCMVCLLPPRGGVVVCRAADNLSYGQSCLLPNHEAIMKHDNPHIFR